jgi:thioredoxin-related protein
MKSVVLFLFVFGLLLALSSESLASFSVQGEDLFSGQKKEVTTKTKGIVLVFLSARCPCSNSHMPLVSQLSQDFPEFQFVAVHSNSDENKAQAQEYFKSQNLSIPVLQDEKSVLANQYKASKTPHVFVLSPTGEILYKGGVTDSADAPSAENQYLRIALNEIKAGLKVSQSETRSLGCAISRGDQHVW